MAAALCAMLEYGCMVTTGSGVDGTKWPGWGSPLQADTGHKNLPAGVRTRCMIVPLHASLSNACTASGDMSPIGPYHAFLAATSTLKNQPVCGRQHDPLKCLTTLQELYRALQQEALKDTCPADVMTHIGSLCEDKDRQTLALVDKAWAKHACASSTTHTWRVSSWLFVKDYARKLTALKKYKPHLKQLTLNFDMGSTDNFEDMQMLLRLPVQTLIINVSNNDPALVQFAACLSDAATRESMQTSPEPHSTTTPSNENSCSSNSMIRQVHQLVKGLGVGLGLLKRQPNAIAKQGAAAPNTMCRDIQVHNVYASMLEWMPAVALTNFTKVKSLYLTRAGSYPPPDSASALAALCKPDLGKRVRALHLQLSDTLCSLLADNAAATAAAFASLEYLVVSNDCLLSANLDSCCVRDATDWIAVKDDHAINKERGLAAARLVCANSRLKTYALLHEHAGSMVANGIAHELARSLPLACEVVFASVVLYDPAVVAAISIFLDTCSNRRVVIQPSNLCRKTCLCGQLAWHHFANNTRASLDDAFFQRSTAPYQVLLDMLAEESPELHAMWSLLRYP